MSIFKSPKSEKDSIAAWLVSCGMDKDKAPAEVDKLVEIRDKNKK